MSFCNEWFTPGRALAAAQPQTELTTTNVVPFCSIAFATSYEVCNSPKPMFVNSSRMGFTNSGGYIYFLFKDIKVMLSDKVLLSRFYLSNLQLIRKIKYD